MPEDWDQRVAYHHYSLGQIAGAVAAILDARGSLRGAAAITGLINRLLGGEQEVPSPTTIRSWLLRVGLHQSKKPLEHADDWVWIVDHTVQIGELKCMIAVAFRLGAWQQREDRVLGFQDVELVGLWPVRTSTGEIVDQQLESAIARTGLPKLIISDDGRDLHRGLALFQQRHPEVTWLYDIKHKTASLLKRELERDPVWTKFAQLANQMKRHVHQTELAFCNPPQQRGKARYMNVDTLVDWGLKVLQWLDNPRPTGRDLDASRIADKIGWLREYREPLRQWHQAMQVIEAAETFVRHEGHCAGSEAELRQRMPSVAPDSLADRLRIKLLEFMRQPAARTPESPDQRLPGSSEVLESIIGKYKTLQGERGQFGATGMLLSIGAFVGCRTVDGIRTALETVKATAVKAWERTHLGSTIQSQRKQAFPNPIPGTKTNSAELTLTGPN